MPTIGPGIRLVKYVRTAGNLRFVNPNFVALLFLRCFVSQ